MWDKRAIDKESARRFACYKAMDGYNDYVKIAQKSLIIYLNAQEYFSQIPFAMPRQAIAKKQCKIGYAVIVHQDFDAVVRLVHHLIHNESLVAIHVDRKNPKLYL